MTATASTTHGTSRVCVGQFAGAHGVRGLARLKPFTAIAEDVVRYGELESEDAARRFAVQVVGQAKGNLIVQVAGIGDRDAAQALNGTRLYVSRDRLPAPAEDEFYHADLIGLPVVAPDGATLGEVRAVHDFGAGDLLELRLGDGRSEMVPFTAAVVPEVDLARGRVVVALPAGLLDAAREDEDAA